MTVPLPVVERREPSIFERKSIKAFQEEVQEIYLADNRPWVVGYSGGKDSTATLQLVWYSLAELLPERRKKPVYVISSDTFVETPVIVDYIDENLDAINRAAKEQNMPFEAHKVTPEIKDTFWVNLIGRGYPPPSSKFRWCTDRMKIQPANKFILDRVADFGEVIMVLGSRQGESASRDQVLKARKIQGSRLRRHSTLPNAFVLAPIEEFTTDDVWTYILQVKCPWGTNNNRLVTMYRNAGAGECPLVVDTSTPSCGNSRFGCWVCTVVEQDHSMESLVDSGEEWMEALLNFRNLLKSHHAPEVKRKVRRLKRRDGKIRLKRDGTPSPGPYELEERKKLLRTLLEVQQQVRREGPDRENRLISSEELHEIRRIWRTEESDWEDSVPVLYREVVGEDLDWVQDDVTALTAKDQEILKSICKKHDAPADLVAKLIDMERHTQGMSRRAGIYDRIDALFRQDWPDEQAREAFRSGLDEAGEEKD